MVVFIDAAVTGAANTVVERKPGEAAQHSKPPLVAILYSILINHHTNRRSNAAHLVLRQRNLIGSKLCHDKSCLQVFCR